MSNYEIITENTSGLGILIEKQDFADTSTEKIINESTNEKDYFINGIFMQADVKNRNGRIYPKSIMEREVNRFIAEKVKTNRASGELDHPDTIKINPYNISHRITELKFNGSDVIGKALILDTPAGIILKKFVDGGLEFGVSSRGLGTVSESIVKEDFFLATIDAVMDPSAPKAMVDATFESIQESNLMNEEKIKFFMNKLSNLPKKDVNARLMEVWCSIMNGLKY